MHKRTHDTAQGAAASALSSEDLARRLLATAASTTHLPSPRRRARPAHASGAVGEPCRPLPTSHDLLYDICSNLDPQDLYALSNTSKAFRSVVTGPSSASLWVAARERVRLPELELPMTDLQYAHLLFGKGCSFCPRKNAGKADVHFRARICSACIKEHFADPAKPKGKQALAKAVGERRLHPLTIQVATETSLPAGSSRSYHIAEVVRVEADLNARFPTVAGRGVEAWVGDLIFVLERSRYKYRPDADPIDDTDSENLHNWIERQDKAKAMNKDELRKARCDEIQRRFERQGFRPGEFDYSFRNHALVRKPELLTERSWPTVEAALHPVMLAARSTARTLRLSLRISEPPYSDNTRPLSALYPRSPRVYMSVPAFRTACDVEGYVEYDALWAAHQTAILDGIDALVRSRIEAMLRSLAIAYADLRTALDQNEGDKTLPDSVRASCIDIPHLPSFIPRTADQPLVATDAQLVAFLSDHPLSIFLCSTCHQLRSGGCMLKHDADCNVWNDPDSGLDALDATTWARCGLPEGNSMSIDGTTLARALHLRQLFDDTTLEGSDDKIDKAARRHGLPRVHRDAESRPVKGLVCPCGRFGGSFQFVRDSFVEAYVHIEQPVWGYVGAPRPLDARQDLFSWPHGFLDDDEDSLDGYDSYDSYPSQREECTVM